MSGGGCGAQVRIMARKMEEDYVRAVELEVARRAKEQLLQSLDRIRAPISVCEISPGSLRILFANRAWASIVGGRLLSRSCRSLERGPCLQRSRATAP